MKSTTDLENDLIGRKPLLRQPSGAASVNGPSRAQQSLMQRFSRRGGEDPTYDQGHVSYGGQFYDVMGKKVTAPRADFPLAGPGAPMGSRAPRSSSAVKGGR